MPNQLVVTGQKPVNLDGFIDSSSDLQVKHGTDHLDDHCQSLDAEHEDLKDPNETIRVKVADFTSGGDDWEISVSHQVSGNTTTWSRSTDHAYRDFSAMTDALEVDVVATSNGSPSASKTRKIWIKTKSVDGQPDRP